MLSKLVHVWGKGVFEVFGSDAMGSSHVVPSNSCHGELLATNVTWVNVFSTGLAVLFSKMPGGVAPQGESAPTKEANGAAIVSSGQTLN